MTFITGQESPLKERSSIAWDRLSTGKGTLVFLMGWKSLPLITEKLLGNGWPASTPVALVRWGTMTKQKTVVGTLADIMELAGKEGILPPMVTIVGDVVTLRERLNWFETKPLFGRRVLVTRALEQAGAFAGALEKDGAEVVAFPTIKTIGPPNWAPLDAAIKNLSGYDWAIFTSVNGVKYFFGRLEKLGLDARELKGVKICAVGPMTAKAIEEMRLRVDLTPGEYVAEGLLSSLGRRGIKGKRFLLPRALKAREVLPDEIRALGGHIDVAPAYRTVKPAKAAAELKRMFEEKEIDAVTFTSSSTVTNFVSTFKKTEIKKLLEGVTIACIGPVTANTAKECGLSVDVMPGKYTIPALCAAMAEHFKEKKKN